MSELKNKRKTLAGALAPQVDLLHQRLERVNPQDEIDDLDRSWKLKEKDFPYSCTDEEGLILYDLITENRLKSGFEISTAFGFSGLYMGMAFKQTGGQLITMDCYIEEGKESCLYGPEELESFIEQVKGDAQKNIFPLGLRFAKEQAESLGLSDIIHFEIGLSPRDVPGILGQRKVDFAFIDGGHFEDQPLKDFLAIYPYLSDKCAVFFHDHHEVTSVQRAVKAAEKKLGVSAQKMVTRYSLTLVSRGLDASSLKALNDLTVRKPFDLFIKKILQNVLGMNFTVRFLKTWESLFERNYHFVRNLYKRLVKRIWP